jgi:serine/threonine protein kinase
MEDTECNRWKNNRNENPVTERRISRNGPTRKRLKRQCIDITPERCIEWKSYPNINPITGKSIKTSGEIYKDFKKNCAKPRNDPKNLKKKFPTKKQTYIDDDDEETDESDDDVYYTFKNPLVDYYNDEAKARYVYPNDFQFINDTLYEINDPDKTIPYDEQHDFFKRREINEALLIKAIEKLGLKRYEMCLSGLEQLKTKINNAISSRGNVVNLIGEGTFGKVYFATLPDTSPDGFVMKEVVLTKGDRNGLVQYRKKGLQKIDIKHCPDEYKLSAFARTMIKDNICANFSYVYDIGLCENCQIGERASSCSVTFMEAADTDLYMLCDTMDSAYTENNKTLENYQETMWSVLFQVLIAMHAMHSLYGIYHRDIKTDNILITKIQPGGYFEYKVNNKLMNDTFYVKNLGIFAMISDFGSAQTFCQKYAPEKYTEDCGHRNAKLVKDQNGNLAFQPITLDYKYVIKSGVSSKLVKNDDIVKWTDDGGVTSTNNRIYTNSKKSRPDVTGKITDLNDMIQYPAFEFFNDIADALRMFAGGTRMTVNTQKHYQMNSDVLKEMIDKINQLGIVDKVTKTESGVVTTTPIPYYSQKHSVKFIVASEMLKYMQRSKDKKMQKDIILSCTM